MMKKALTVETVAPPCGPYSHSYAVTLGDQKLIFLAGQYATDREGGLVGKGDMFTQTQQTLLNIEEVLHANGATFNDVIKITTFVTDMSKRSEVSRARAAFLSDPPPASTLIEVTKFVDPDYLIEMDVIAAVPIKPAENTQA